MSNMDTNPIAVSKCRECGEDITLADRTADWLHASTKAGRGWQGHSAEPTPADTFPKTLPR